MGRSLTNTMINTGVEAEFEEAVYEVHIDEGHMFSTITLFNISLSLLC